MKSIDTSNPTASFEFTFDDDVVDVTLEFHFSENVEEFFDVTSLVEGMSSAILREVSGL